MQQQPIGDPTTVPTSEQVTADTSSNATDNPTTETEQTAEQTKATEAEPVAAVPFDPVPGEISDAGNIRAICPEGWFSVPVRDFFSDKDDALTPDKVRLIKGTDDDWAQVPYIVITFLGTNHRPMSLDEQKEYYDTTADLEPFMIGTDIWEGFSYAVGDSKVEAIIRKRNDPAFDVLVILQDKEETISLTDADVQTILSTIHYE